MSPHDPWNVSASDPLTTVVVAEELRGPRPRWWRTAGSIGTPRPWYEESGTPAFGDHVSLNPNSWIGLALVKKAFEGGPAVHTGSYDGNLVVPPNKLVEQMTTTMGLRPVRYQYGHVGVNRILFSSDDSMLSLNFYNGGKSVDVTMASSNEEVFKKVAKLCDGILTQDNPKEGFVYALAKAPSGGYGLTRVGAAGSPLERGNYTADVLAKYDHVVADLKADAPCGRLIIMAGEPGGGKTYMVRSLLSEVPRAAFIIVPSHMVKELGSPELLPALASVRHDGLNGPLALIVEDADKVLVQREAGDMAAISSLLNMGDGILGSVLDVRIIATTNASELEMDAATRRPGRLCSYMNVGPAQPELAESILHRLTGKTKRPVKAQTLAEIYRFARELGWMPPPKEKPASPWEKSYIL